MSLHAALTPPNKRDVAGMELALGQLSTGDRLSALLQSERYGAYLVEGVLYESPISRELYLGGERIAGPVQRKKRRDGSESDVRTITKALRAFREIPDGDTLGAPGGVDELEHGDLVIATLTANAHGTFRTAALVTAGESDGFLLAGRWIVRQGDVLAVRADSVELIDKRDMHPLAVPPVRAVLADDEESEDEAL